MMCSLIPLFFTIGWFHVDQAGASQSRVLQSILHDYDTRVLPVANESEPMVVEIGLALQQVISVDQKTQLVKLAIWMRQYWNDYQLTWDPAEFNGTNMVYMPSSQHWKPDIVFYDNAHSEQPEVWQSIPTTVSNTGDIVFMYPAIIQVTCPQNVKNFPMDTQTCGLKFGSWTYDGGHLHVKARKTNAADFNQEHIKRNDEWEVIHFEVQENSNYYGCCDAPFYDVVFTVAIKRHWRMIFLYLYIPNIFVNILTICQFLLPCDSSERCTLGITLFLSIIVYLLLLNGVLPNSDDVPIIIIYMLATLVMNGCSQICNILVLLLHFSGVHDNHKALPQWARHYILHKLAKYLGMGNYITSDAEHESKLKSYQSIVCIDEDDDENEELVHVQEFVSPDSTQNTTRPRSGMNRVHIQNVHENPALNSIRVEESISTLASDGSSKLKVTGLAPEKPCLKITLSVVDHHKQTNVNHSNKNILSGHTLKAELTDNEEILTYQILKHLDEYKSERTEMVRDAELKCEWMQVAMVISRLLLYIYLLMTLLMGFYVIGFINNYTYE